MMLFVGGQAQGQAEYAAAVTGRTPVTCATPEEAFSSPAIDQFHLLCQAILKQGGDVNAFVDRLLAENPGAVVVSEETGVISVARDGKLERYYDASMLTDVIEQTYGLKANQSGRKKKLFRARKKGDGGEE